MQILTYSTADERCPFGEWLDQVNSIAAAKIHVAVSRLEQGNLSNVKSVGKGVREYKINHGPGYRLYFGIDGDAVIILLLGGTNRRQTRI